jgi:hypothetical protein
MIYDYFVKDIEPVDLKNHLKAAGKLGWKYVGCIIMMEQRNVVLGQVPQIRQIYRVIMERISSRIESKEVETILTGDDA